MGRGTYYFASPADNAELHNFAITLGLTAFPILMEQDEIGPDDDPALGPFCYLSPLPRRELHPYGTPPRIGYATDPLIEFWRAYYLPPDQLVKGRVFCSDDSSELYRITKSYYDKIARWIRASWFRLPHGRYIGPEAKLLWERGAELLELPPGLKIRQVDPRTKSR